MDEERRLRHNAVIDLLEQVRLEAEGILLHVLTDWSFTGLAERPQLVARCKRCGAVALLDYLTPALIPEASIATAYPCLYDYPVAEESAD